MTDNRPGLVDVSGGLNGRWVGFAPRVGIRDYFAAEHLWNTRHMAMLAETRETALQASGFRGIDREVRAYCTSAVLESVAYLEAVVNGVWQDVAAVDPATNSPDNPRVAGLSTEAINRMTELWNSTKVERVLSVVEKFQVALTCVDQPRIEMGREPGQIVDAVIHLRNALVHFKPETNWIDEKHRLQGALEGRLKANPLTDIKPWFPNQVLTARCADLAYTAVREFGEEWRSRMGIAWNPAVEADRMDDQLQIP